MALKNNDSPQQSSRRKAFPIVKKCVQALLSIRLSHRALYELRTLQTISCSDNIYGGTAEKNQEEKMMLEFLCVVSISILIHAMMVQHRAYWVRPHHLRPFGSPRNYAVFFFF